MAKTRDKNNKCQPRPVTGLPRGGRHIVAGPEISSPRRGALTMMDSKTLPDSARRETFSSLASSDVKIPDNHVVIHRDMSSKKLIQIIAKKERKNVAKKFTELPILSIIGQIRQQKQRMSSKKEYLKGLAKMRNRQKPKPIATDTLFDFKKYVLGFVPIAMRAPIKPD